MQCRLHRWRFNLKTGAVREEVLSDQITEFGTINDDYSGKPNRYIYAASGVDGWFLFNGIVRHDLHTGDTDAYRPDGVYGSETQMAPRVGSTSEDDGYLVTLTTDMNDDASYCVVLDAAWASPTARYANCDSRAHLQRDTLHLGPGGDIAGGVRPTRQHRRWHCD